jgi:glycosyltransferase involved in cell wall biosynthesis
LVCDALTGGAFEDAAIADLRPKLALGVARIPMRRHVSFTDLHATRNLMRELGKLSPDVVHGHGAKGGVYGRLIGTWLGRGRPIARVYSPHGGSLHYSEKSIEGRAYFAIERWLERLTDALVHVSAYEADTYRHKVGAPRCGAYVIRNGLRADEYEPVVPAPHRTDLLFLGMIRDLKGVDVLLHALGHLRTFGRSVSAHIIGQVEDIDFVRYQSLANSLGISGQIAWGQPRPTREAFAMARAIVVPSRAESMPYVVLEAVAAGMPIVATRVGGVPEILGPRADELVPPGDPAPLAEAIEHLLADPATAQADAAARREWLMPRFNIAAMRDQVGKLYDAILTAKTTRESVRERANARMGVAARPGAPRYLP